MDQLNADPVPFPLRRIIRQVDAGLVERMREHERAEHRNVLGGGLLGAALAPVEQLGEWRPQPVPHFLDLLDVEPERVGERLLGQPRRNPDPKRPGGELEDRKPSRGVEMVEHRLEHLGTVRTRRGGQARHGFGQRDGAIVDLWLDAIFPLAHPSRPQQRHRLGHVADIVAAHPQQHRVDPFLGEPAHHGGFDRGNVERASQRGERQPAVGIGGGFEVIADQPQLRIARAGVDEVVEQLAEGTHGPSMHDGAIGSNQWRRTASAARIDSRSRPGSLLISASPICSMQQRVACLPPGSMTWCAA